MGVAKTKPMKAQAAREASAPEPGSACHCALHHFYLRVEHVLVSQARQSSHAAPALMVDMPSQGGHMIGACLAGLICHAMVACLDKPLPPLGLYTLGACR